MKFRLGQFVVPIVSYTEDIPSPGIDSNRLYQITNISEEDQLYIWICPAGFEGQEYGSSEQNLRLATMEEVNFYVMLFI